jgi:hypothetical protein
MFGVVRLDLVMSAPEAGGVLISAIRMIVIHHSINISTAFGSPI